MSAERRMPLRWAITIGATAIVMFALVVTALAVSGLLGRSIAAGTEALLVDRVDAVRQIAASGDLPEVLEPTGREVGQVQVIDHSGVVVSSTLGLARTSRFDVIDPPGLGQTTREIVDGTKIDDDPSERYLVVATTVSPVSGQLTIYGVTSMDPADDAQGYLQSRLLIVLPLLALLTGAVIFAVVGRALRPVEEMRSQVEQISATDLSSRVVPPASDDEIARLGTTLNRLLERLDVAASQQQIFAASASHELRSPLAAIRTNLEVGLAYPGRTDWEQTANEALIEIDRLEKLSTDLRTLTRQPAMVAPEPIDLVDVTEREVARRPHPRLTLCTAASPAFVAIELDAYLQVLRNLLDNAERHAEHAVAVHVDEPRNGTVRLRVFNDGDPVLPADRRRVFEPFMRLDEGRTIDAGGSGLGLAIAKTIVSGAGGTIHVSDRPTGAEFVVSFPTASRPQR